MASPRGPARLLSSGGPPTERSPTPRPPTCAPYLRALEAEAGLVDFRLFANGYTGGHAAVGYDGAE